MDLQSFFELFKHTAAVPQSPFDEFLFLVKNAISLIGSLVIIFGVISGIYRVLLLKFAPRYSLKKDLGIDFIRRDLGRTIVLGLEFIIAGDVISTTITPDYYSLGILAIIVIIRTFLSYSLSREINSLSPAEQKKFKNN